MSARDQGLDTLASQYLRLIVSRACLCSSGDRIRAVAANSGPLSFPRIVQGATLTCGLLRMRLVFPISLRVITYSLPLSSPNQTGVGTPTPVLRKVTSEMYFCLATAVGIGFVMPENLEVAVVKIVNSAPFRLILVVRKCLCELLLSCNLCYKPEHA